MSVFIPFSAQIPGVWQGGRVYEIFRDPPNADYPNGDYRLWIGTATIEHSSDYSHFVDAERLHILLSGDGLDLCFRNPDQIVALASHNCYTFSGERPVHARMHGAPVVGFNLIYRVGLTSSAEFVTLSRTSDRHTIQVETGTVQTQIVYVVSGVVALTCVDGERVLEQGDTMVWDLNSQSTADVCLQSQTAEACILLAQVSDPDVHSTTSE